ncbi:MAG: 2-C-methyl-D-erythritol 4-phosphate cytidylyltransferase [Acidobacteria bacterium]|nr:MAG: 2-C-methyl-D-erythritol 4-phosphate cytidylyltransferase [Acidobacteriota bacterium]
MASFAVILPAAGRSSRFKDKEKKPFVNLDGRAVWLRSVELFVSRPDVVQCLIVVAPEDQETFRRRYQANLVFMNVQIVSGGAERFESVANALDAVKPEVDFIAIHDAVRPCLAEATVSTVFTKAEETGAAMLAIPVADTLKQADEKKKVQQTVSRKGLWLAQTPQIFRRDWLVEAYAKRGQLGKDITDDAQLIEAAGHTVHLVDGASTNIKITTRADLTLAEAILKAMPKPKPTGPAHPFAEEEMWGGRGLR